MTKTEESKYLHKSERHQFQDELRHLQTRQGRFDAAKLPRKGRAVLCALMVDWRTMPASKLAGVSRNCVDRWKTKLKTHFVQCHRAWERDFVK